MLAGELGRLSTRRDELAAAGDALMMLRARMHTGGVPSTHGIEELSQELAAPIVDRISSTVDRVDNVVTSLTVGAGVEDVHSSHELERARAGQRQRSLYTEEVLSDPQHLGKVGALRAGGQQQRVLDRMTHEFAIFGDEAVITPSRWEVPSSDYLVIRNEALVGCFQGWFDLVWGLSAPRSDPEGDPDDLLVQMLWLGYKDEAIARHLGVALRTVRRRVASLMDVYGVGTRLQLGVALDRAGRLERRPL